MENNNKLRIDNKEILDCLKDIVKEELDTSEWKEYIVGDLFEKLTLKFNKTKFNKNEDVSSIKTKEFNLPLVNAKLGNNGIMYYGKGIDFDSAEMTIDIVSDGVVSAGSAYPQPQNTGVLYNAYLIKPIKSINKNVLFFLSTIINANIQHLFAYENKAIWEKVKKISIKLPSILNETTNEFEPDWQYMEDYITELEKDLNVKKQKL